MTLNDSIGLLFIFFLFVFIFLLAFILRYRMRLKENKELKMQFSQTLLQSQLEIQEQTLQHISRELHDNLGQVASLIKINLLTIPIGDAAKAQQKLEDTRELTRQLITDIKSLSVSLGGDRIAQTGLAAALQTEMERINRTEQFSAIFEQQGTLAEPDNDKAIILYRMVQEVLNNMVKHSDAKQIKLTLTATKNFLTLAISDDGKGFDVIATKQQQHGAGLRNLEKRAALIHAQLDIQSTIGEGTRITIELPITYDPYSTGKTGTG